MVVSLLKLKKLDTDIFLIFLIQYIADLVRDSNTLLLVHQITLLLLNKLTLLLCHWAALLNILNRTQTSSTDQ